jgi:SAM-dependent methyltransferase
VKINDRQAGRDHDPSIGRISAVYSVGFEFQLWVVHVSNTNQMTSTETLQNLLKDPQHRESLRLGYLGGSPLEDAELFSNSAEFAETLKLLGGGIEGKIIADIGAGRGIATYAFAKAGAGRIYAVEPDTTDWVGGGAIPSLGYTDRIEIVPSYGEDIGLPDEAVDVVYCRQVLHHARDLPKFLEECHRVLKPGGKFIACREHRSDTKEDLAAFLAAHPRGADEHAFPLKDYLSAITDSGLGIQSVLGPYDSVICAYPEMRSTEELRALPGKVLVEKWGIIGGCLSRFPIIRRKVIEKLNSRPRPGKLYSFLASKRA